MGVILSLAFLYTSIAVIHELVRVKALKWNATAYSLFWMTYSMFGVLCVDLIYMTNTWGADKIEYWYNSRSALFIYFIVPAGIIVDFEIGVTWIDLYDRTQKMSKSSSKRLKALRIFLRLVAFTISWGFLLWVSLGGTLHLLVSALMPSVVGIIFIVVASNVIIRTLCPDKKDQSNPNWKVAEAIRRAVKYALTSKTLEIIALLGMAVTPRHPQLGYTYAIFNTLYFWATNFRQWGWLHYLIYANRKNLTRYANENVSAFFGFATIPINKKLASMRRR
eukprot:scaffold1961_cov219-Alexandrium_tamarense.AAC.18